MRRKKYLAIVVSLLLITLLIMPIVNVSAQSVGTSERLFDRAGLYTEAEYEQVNTLLLETEQQTGLYVSIITLDDVGSDKSDDAVVDMVDVFYEQQFGINSDGIILLINNDHASKWNWISTSGQAIRIFTDGRIDNMFDNFWDYKISGDYLRVAEKFCDDVRFYNIWNIVGPILFGLVASVVVCVVFVLTVKHRYKISPATHSDAYLERGSVRYGQRSDVFIRRYVTKTRIESNSGGGGGFSSTHTSSGGGSHGGGGRRG